MRTSNRIVFGLLLLVLVVAALRLTRVTAPRNGAGQPSTGLGQVPMAQPFPRLQIGAPAPDAHLLDWEGREYRLSDYHRQRVLVAFFCDSPQCIHLASQWEKIHQQAPDVIVLGISTRGPQVVLRFRQETHVTFPLLFDPNYQFARPEDRTPCPSAAVIDEGGTVVYLFGRSGSLQTGISALRQHLRIR